MLGQPVFLFKVGRFAVDYQTYIEAGKKAEMSGCGLAVHLQTWEKFLLGCCPSVQQRTIKKT